MQLNIDQTYKDHYDVKWSIIHKLPSGMYIGWCVNNNEERIRKFDANGLSAGSAFNSIQLSEIDKEWFGIEITIDGNRKLVNGTWGTREEAQKQADETWWKSQPRVVRLWTEEI